MGYRYTFNPGTVRAGVQTGKRCRIRVLTVTCFLFALFLCSEKSLAEQARPAILPSPVTSSKYFPCTKCHQDGNELEKRSAAIHNIINVKGHLGKKYDCFSCHDREDLNKLRLFDGSQVDLEDSSRLCGQCHSTNYTLWESRLHGKIKGTWNGAKKIFSCTQCHDPHEPVFAAQVPQSPPTPPEETLRWRK